MTVQSVSDIARRDASQKSPTEKLRGFLKRFEPQLALALPKHLSAERMARLALTAFSSTPALQKCDPMTIAASLMTASQLGLEPGVNGAGYLIPYGRTCTFVPGWKGLVDLVSRSGRGTVYTGVIFRDQEYTFIDGARRDLVIHNETSLSEPEDITHAFAIGWVKDATMPIIELWRVEKIEAHRNKYNKVGSRHYSFRDWEMYARKIPLLQVLKYMPSSIELANAIEISNANESGRNAVIEGQCVVTSDIVDDGREEQQEERAAPEKPAAKEEPKPAAKTADKPAAIEHADDDGVWIPTAAEMEEIKAREMADAVETKKGFLSRKMDME